MMFSRLGTCQKFNFFFYKKAGFSVIVSLSAKKIDVVQILVYTIKPDENKALAKSFIPRNSKTLNVEKLLKTHVRLLVLGRGTFAVVEKGRQGEKAVVIKKFYTSFSNEITKAFAKEARLLNTIDHKNIVKLLRVSETPLAIIMEYLEFSFMPFGRSECVNSLDKMLNILDKDDLVKDFQGIENYIASDIINGLYHMHANGIVHRDIKPSNILVSNQHYYNEHGFQLNEGFFKQPIVCKLGNLGEARSESTHMKHIDRGSPAFMAPETQVDSQLLTTADLNDFKKN